MDKSSGGVAGFAQRFQGAKRMPGRLQGKWALVTAAGQGIGRATVEAFAAEGAEVYATDVDMSKLAGLKGRPGITTMKLDVLDPAAILAVTGQIGTLNVLFNCAGFVHHGTILDATEDEWSFAFDLNVRAMFRITRAVLPAMIANGGGSIINISSICGAHRGIPNRFIYGASKAAVLGLTKSVAADFVRQGIRCNAICPGTIQTPSLDERINAFDDPVQARKDFVARQPMGRLGTAEEIAQLNVYLASDDSVFVTGQAMFIDGGMTI